jgi:hypothetical protein
MTASYRVRDGHQLAHLGGVLAAGTSVELDIELARDPAVAEHVEPVTLATPAPVRAEPPAVVAAAPAAAPSSSAADTAGSTAKPSKQE